MRVGGAALHVGKATIALPALQAEFGRSLETLSWVISAFPFVGVFGGIAAGLLVRRWGDRRLLALGLLIVSAAAMPANSTLMTASQGVAAGETRSMASGLIAVITLSSGGNALTMRLRYDRSRSNAALSRGEIIHFELYFARLVVWFASVPPCVDAGARSAVYCSGTQRACPINFIYKEQCMSEMMNENGAPVMEWSYGGRGDDISSSLTFDTVEEQPHGFLMTVDRPVQIFKEALSPLMAFVTLLRPLYAKTGEGFQFVPVSNPWTDVQRLPPSAGYLGVQVNAGLFFHGAKPTHYKDRDGQMKPIDGGTVLQNITVLHQVAQPQGPGEGGI